MAAELAKPEIDEIIRDRVSGIVSSGTPAGNMLMMAAGFVGGPAGLVPVIKPLVVEFGKELAKRVSCSLRCVPCAPPQLTRLLNLDSSRMASTQRRCWMSRPCGCSLIR